MDVKNLETASEYINNLLLSRGLLRNGEPISFAHPSQGEGGKQATIAKVINLVHDMILRKDDQRESETLVKLSQDAVTLRGASVQQTQTIHKLETRVSDLERQLALKTTSEKTALTSLKTAEAKHKALKDDMIRLKATVSQIRSQCANDARKKETELKRLQKYLEVKRGREGSVQVGVTVVNPGASLQGSIGSHGTKQTPRSSLHDESNDYITRLARELSSENQALRSLARTTTKTLRQLQGIPDPLDDDQQSEDSFISQISSIPCETLQSDLQEILEQLQSLLTNPSFVSLEEVEIREDEIVRLREGWEKMEARWREALNLMNGWRKRMMETGDAINLDDLRKGLILGSTPITLPPPTSVRKGRLSASHLPSPDDSVIEDRSTSMSLDQQEESLRVALEANAEPVSPIKEDPKHKLGRGLFPAPAVLKATAGNAQRIPVFRRRARDESDQLAVQRQEQSNPSKKRRISDEADLDDILAAGCEDDGPLPDAKEDNHESEDDMENVTIEQKLLRAKQEAQAASAASKHAIESEGVSVKGSDEHERAEPAQMKEASKPIKRNKAPLRLGPGGMRRSKRRSTLSPEELEGLIGA